MGEKVMIDFPGFITRDSKSRWLMVGDDSHVLISNTVLAEMYRQLFKSLGYEKTAKILYQSAFRGTHLVQNDISQAYHLTIKSEAALADRIAKMPFYIQTYGHGRGKTVRKGREFIFQVRDSSIARYLKEMKPEGPMCSFLAGFFAGMAEAYAARLKPTKYVCVETRCLAVGDPYCEFKLSPRK